MIITENKRLNIRDFTRGGRAVMAKDHYEEMKRTESESIEKSIKDCKIFRYGEMKYYMDIKYENNIIINPTDTVSEIFTVDSIIDKVAVLNFASYKNPGGQFLEGSPAQEEALCHTSTLYNVLEAHTEDYYKPHMQTLNKALYTHELLYSPNIKFFDYHLCSDGESTVRTVNGTRIVDVINCAAPNTGTYTRYNGRDDNLIKRTLEDRIELILDTAVYNKVDILILGAFGCGVFRNDPYLVASIFKDFIDGEFEGVFREIHFPIPLGKDNNFEAFKEVFGV